MIITTLMIAAFTILYLSQSTAKSQRIYLQIRISRGQLSNKEIAELSQDTPDPILLSGNNRLYFINDKRSACFIRRDLALTYCSGITL